MKIITFRYIPSDPQPPTINFVHGTYKYHIDIISHVAAAPGPLACPSRNARPPSLSQPQRLAP